MAFIGDRFPETSVLIVHFLLLISQVRAASATSPLALARLPAPSNQAKYFELLARYYVLKRQHVLAAHVLVRLAERRSTDGGDAPTLEQRYLFQLT